jgi:hypothetical protein
MDTDVWLDHDVGVDAPQSRWDCDATLALYERLLISALVAGVTLWIRLVDVVPDRRHR